MHLQSSSSALLTDHYELTMLASALQDGNADLRCSFEVFARELPPGRRYGVVAGVGRLVDAVQRFQFRAEELEFLRETGVITPETRDWLAGYRFTGDIETYPEGELYFPGSPIATVTASFAEAVVLETLVLSILNHDCAIASAAARMVTAASGRNLLEMGSRRTHEKSAVAAARAAYIAGFGASSNLEAGRRYGIPTSGTAAHAFTLLHTDERDAFHAQIKTLGLETTLLVDTYDISQGIRNAIEVAGPTLGAIRIDSGDLAVMAHKSRELLDSLGAHSTKIVLSGDLDEYSIAGLAAAPVDAYGVGTALVIGSGAPTAGLVYKLVEVEGRAVAKRSANKPTRGGRKTAIRRHKKSGTAIEEVIAPHSAVADEAAGDVVLPRPLIRRGFPVPHQPGLAEARERLRRALTSIPWEGLKLSRGEPVLPVRYATTLDHKDQLR